MYQFRSDKQTNTNGINTVNKLRIVNKSPLFSAWNYCIRVWTFLYFPPPRFLYVLIGACWCIGNGDGADWVSVSNTGDTFDHPGENPPTNKLISSSATRSTAHARNASCRSQLLHLVNLTHLDCALSQCLRLIALWSCAVCCAAAECAVWLSGGIFHSGGPCELQQCGA